MEKTLNKIIADHGRLVRAYLDAASHFPDDDETRIVLERVAGTLRLALSHSADYFHLEREAVAAIHEEEA